ncbi:type II secretion system major pseudopilin GspG [Planctomycetota bacterium]|nr:type II secretion system major pseudopilin GspG [Planctomycetota bacterium]
MYRKEGLGVRGGFTLIEILVVVVLIGVLMALVAPKFIGRIGQAKSAVAAQKIVSIESAISTFNLDYERYPENLRELIEKPADIEDAKWMPPSLKEKDLLDPWGNEIEYVFPGNHGYFDLISYGADSQEGGEGDNADITNW